VVDAMERDMVATIATKSDLQLLRQELRHDLASREDVSAVRVELADIRGELSELRQDNVLIRKDMELLSTTMTVRLGSMLMLGLGLLFAALKLT
jgi:hypothetical protein